MATELACSCGQRMRVGEDAAGKKVKCPACGRIQDVPPEPPSLARPEEPSIFNLADEPGLKSPPTKELLAPKLKRKGKHRRDSSRRSWASSPAAMRGIIGCACLVLFGGLAIGIIFELRREREEMRKEIAKVDVNALLRKGKRSDVGEWHRQRAGHIEREMQRMRQIQQQNAKLMGNIQATRSYEQGEAALKKEEFDGAIAAFTAAIQSDPKFARAYLARASAYMSKAALEQELGSSANAKMLDPKLAPAVRENAAEYFDRMIADCNKAIALDPKLAEAYSGRGFAFLGKGNNEQAIAEFTKGIELGDKFAEVYGGRGVAYLAIGALDKAIADCTEAVRLDPKDAESYSTRARAFHAKGDCDQAIADCTRAIALEPNLLEALLGRGHAYRDKGEYAKAGADFTEAVRKAPNDADAHEGLAWLWATCPDAAFRDGKKALEYATKACQLTDWKDPNILDTLAAAYAELGKFDEAVQWEKKALEYLKDAKEPVLQELADQARGRLKLYEEGKPCREQPLALVAGPSKADAPGPLAAFKQPAPAAGSPAVTADKQAGAVVHVLEAEKLPIVESNRCKSGEQSMESWGADQWSNGSQLFCAAEPGGYIELPLTPPKPGRYRLEILFTKADDFGIVEVSLDGKKIGEQFDGFNEKVVPSGKVGFGVVDLTRSDHRLRFTSVAKNSRSKNTYLGIDCLKLAPVASPP